MGYILFQLFYCLAPWSDSSSLRILEVLSQQYLALSKLPFKKKNQKNKHQKTPAFKELAGPAEAVQESTTADCYQIVPSQGHALSLMLFLLDRIGGGSVIRGKC